MVDVFGEVDEQVRADRLRSVVRNAWPWFVGALVVALAAVIGVWGYGQYQLSQAGKASLAYGQGLDSLQKGDAAKAYDQFAASALGRGGYAALSLIQQGGIRLDQGKAAEAVALFDKAAEAAPGPMIGDLARLKAAYALIDTATLSQMSDRLTPLIKPDRPYHGQAREALALAKIAAGQTKAARDDFSVLSLLSDTPDGLRQRAEAAIALIDSGTAASLKELVHQSLTVPPAPLAPITPAAPDQAAPAQPETPQ